MQRQVLNGKIHNATVTDACVDYEGSITIDADLLRAADILSGEKVLVANVTNGARIESYAIEGKAGSGVVCLNGGAAKHGKKGDRVIIMSFVVLDEVERRFHQSMVIRVNGKNQIIS